VVALKRLRLLFITGNRVGDAVLSTGVLAHFLAERPGASVTVACGPLAAPLFADLPGLARIVPIVKAKRRRIGHWIALWRSLSGQKWDDVIDLRSAFFAWTVRAERRWVCRAEKRHEHRVEELGRQLGVAPPPAPHLWLSPEREARAAALVADGRPLLAIGAGANWGGKRWPAERFAELARRLTAASGILPGARILVLGADSERDSVLPLLEAGADPLDWVGDRDLLDVFALLRRTAMFIGNDSGLMHMAAAAGIPTLGLFGPSAEWRYRPWGPICAVIRTPESLEQLTGGAGYDYRSHRSLMTSLTVDRVTEAAEQLWQGRNEPC
jgi:ADP-heptose:LPS heptosyltransferase